MKKGKQKELSVPSPLADRVAESTRRSGWAYLFLSVSAARAGWRASSSSMTRTKPSSG